MYLRAGDKIDWQKIQSLSVKDTGELFFVLESERPLYKKYVHELISSNIPPQEKAAVLRTSSMSLVEELFEHPDVNVALDESRPIIDNFVTLMDFEPEAMGYLIGLSSHDFYTYNHSLDVAIYSLGLGQSVGFSKRDLEELGMGALFHDIGKRSVSLDILCKKGSLNDAEWAQMQEHPNFGLIILNQNPNMSDAIKAACFEHHESWAGNGYPQQLMGEEIHPFARIVAIADTFDAMTTQRSYNVPLKPVDAVTMMKEKLASRYDPNLINALYGVLFKLKNP